MDEDRLRPFLSPEAQQDTADLDSLASLISQNNSPENVLDTTPLLYEVGEEEIDIRKVKCLRTKKGRYLSIALIICFFLSLFIALITLHYKWQRTDIKTMEPEAKFENGIYGKIRIRKINIKSKAATVFIDFGIGDKLMKSIKKSNLKFSFDEQAEIEYDGKEFFIYEFNAKNNNFKFHSGTSLFYPFDKYTYPLKSKAVLSNNQTVPVYYYLDSSILLFRSKVVIANNKATLVIQRSATTIIITMLCMFILWGFAISYFLLALRIVVFKRDFLLPDLNLGLSLLFNVNSLRNMMPSAPKIGVLVDIISVLWCLALISIAVVGILIAGWIREMYQSSSLEIINTTNSLDDTHPSLPSPEVLSIDQNEIVFEQNFEQVQTLTSVSILNLNSDFEAEMGIQSSLNRESILTKSYSQSTMLKDEINISEDLNIKEFNFNIEPPSIIETISRKNDYFMKDEAQGSSDEEVKEAVIFGDKYDENNDAYFESDNFLKLKFDGNDNDKEKYNSGSTMEFIYKDSVLGTKLENVLSETQFKNELELELNQNKILD
ncbi:hypothetical protein K502DRAFT_349105 [Neoconidiobolus thromboides FSU 785]|nr:hypothetical protein K502DRAFT_349105 [Neoconidiobolus thromboides FSU 785]